MVRITCLTVWVSLLIGLVTLAPQVVFAGKLAPIEDRSDAFYGERYGKPSPAWKVGKLKKSRQYRVAEVQPGDTLHALSKRYGVSTRSLISLNKLSTPYALKAGQRIKVGGTPVYKVGKGDTLYQIARKRGVTVHALAKLNRLRKPYALEVGQVLLVPYQTVKPASLDKKNTITQVAKRKAKKPGSFTQKNPFKLASIAPASGKPQAKKSLPATAKAKRSEPASLMKKLSSWSPFQLASVEPAQITRNVTPKTTSLLYDKKKKKVGHKRGSAKFNWPTKGTLLSSFGSKKRGVYNDGINISAPEGQAIKASAAGTVVYLGNGLKGYGNLLIIRHRGGWMTAYAHQQKFAVKKGQKIKKGQIVGYVGKSGNVDRPQLHFAIRKGSEAVDPLGMLPS